jgi:hypothetical protein
VVAERDDVRSRVQEPVGEARRDARPVGSVLAVDDAEVRVTLLAQRRQAFLDGSTSRRAEDVGDEEQSQFRTSAEAGWISIETWLPESFV